MKLLDVDWNAGHYDEEDRHLVWTVEDTATAPVMGETVLLVCEDDFVCFADVIEVLPAASPGRSVMRLQRTSAYAYKGEM